MPICLRVWAQSRCKYWYFWIVSKIFCCWSIPYGDAAAYFEPYYINWIGCVIHTYLFNKLLKCLIFFDFGGKPWIIHTEYFLLLKYVVFSRRCFDYGQTIAKETHFQRYQAFPFFIALVFFIKNRHRKDDITHKKFTRKNLRCLHHLICQFDRYTVDWIISCLESSSGIIFK